MMFQFIPFSVYCNELSLIDIDECLEYYGLGVVMYVSYLPSSRCFSDHFLQISSVIARLAT